jgi:sphingomyelin phosphodiesterase acid-like 3
MTILKRWLLGLSLLLAIPCYADEFLTIADIHFDPFISCHSTPCPLLTKLNNAPPEEWEALLAAYDHTEVRRGFDTNYPLLKATLNFAKAKAEQEQVKFVLVLGDLISHQTRWYYRKYIGKWSLANYAAFTKKTLLFLTWELNKTFPDLNIYVAVGNNDSYHGDYETSIRDSFFPDMTLAFSSLIKNADAKLEMQKDFPHGGYYAVNLQPNLRLIMLNSNVFSKKALGRDVSSIAANQLQWLHQELIAAEEHHQQVWIAMHIPETIDLYLTERMRLFSLAQLWQQNDFNLFQKEVNEFAPSITTLFAAHLHSNWIHYGTVLRAEIPLVGTTSISPIFGNAPGFALYTMNHESTQIQNATTYYYPFN